jgi:TrkA domain protein
MARPSDSINEVDLPGIGRRFELTDATGDPIAVVVHHGGRRDLYAAGRPARPGRAATTGTTLSFTDDQARRLAAILGGVYFKPAVVAQVEAVIGGLLIDWVTLRDDSPGTGHSIADLEIRQHTRMTVAAIVRDDVSIVSPDPSEVLASGDRLVVIGQPGDMASFVAAVVG